MNRTLHHPAHVPSFILAVLAVLLAFAGSAIANDKRPTVTESGGGLVLTFKCLNAASRGMAVLSVQHSSDLGIADSWDAAALPEATGSVSGVGFVVTPDGNLIHIVVTIPSTEGPAGRLFGRLEASQPKFRFGNRLHH